MKIDKISLLDVNITHYLSDKENIAKRRIGNNIYSHEYLHNQAQVLD